MKRTCLVDVSTIFTTCWKQITPTVGVRSRGRVEVKLIILTCGSCSTYTVGVRGIPPDNWLEADRPAQLSLWQSPGRWHLGRPAFPPPCWGVARGNHGLGGGVGEEGKEEDICWGEPGPKLSSGSAFLIAILEYGG